MALNVKDVEAAFEGVDVVAGSLIAIVDGKQVEVAVPADGGYNYTEKAKELLAAKAAKTEEKGAKK